MTSLVNNETLGIICSHSALTHLNVSHCSNFGSLGLAYLRRLPNLQVDISDTRLACAEL